MKQQKDAALASRGLGRQEGPRPRVCKTRFVNLTEMFALSARNSSSLEDQFGGASLCAMLFLARRRLTDEEKEQRVQQMRARVLAPCWTAMTRPLTEVDAKKHERQGAGRGTHAFRSAGFLPSAGSANSETLSTHVTHNVEEVLNIVLARV